MWLFTRSRRHPNPGQTRRDATACVTSWWQNGGNKSIVVTPSDSGGRQTVTTTDVHSYSTNTENWWPRLELRQGFQVIALYIHNCHGRIRCHIIIEIKIRTGHYGRQITASSRASKEEQFRTSSRLPASPRNLVEKENYRILNNHRGNGVNCPVYKSNHAIAYLYTSHNLAWLFHKTLGMFTVFRKEQK